MDSARTYLAWVGDRAPNDREKWLYCRTLIGLYEQYETLKQALDRIEGLLGVVDLTFLSYEHRQRVNTAWACACEHSGNPTLIPRDAVPNPASGPKEEA